MNKLALGGLVMSAAAAVIGIDTMREGPISTFAAETLRILQCSGNLPNGMPCPSPKTAQSIPAVKPPAGTENLTLWADTESNKPGLILERGSGIAAAPGGLWADQVYSGLKDNQKQLVIDNGRWVGDPTGLSGKSCEIVAGTTKIKCGNDSEVDLKGATGDNGPPGKSCAIVPGTTRIKCGNDPEVDLKGATGNTGSPGSPGSPGTSCSIVPGTTKVKCGLAAEVEIACVPGSIAYPACISGLKTAGIFKRVQADDSIEGNPECSVLQGGSRIQTRSDIVKCPSDFPNVVAGGCELRDRSFEVVLAYRLISSEPFTDGTGWRCESALVDLSPSDRCFDFAYRVWATCSTLNFAP